MRETLQAIWRQAGNLASNESTFRVATFLFQALRDVNATKAWLTCLDLLGKKHALGTAPVECVRKPFFNYAVVGLSPSQRVSLLQNHYSLISTAVPALLSVSWSHRSFELGHLYGKHNEIYCLSLRPAGHCYKEGELSLVLSDAADGLELAKLTFMLGRRKNGEPSVLVGGLQGPSSRCGPNSKARIVKATRALSGLRPKMAVFVAVTALAREIGAKKLFAVSNDTHSINADAWWQRRRMHSDYDAFWRERGGERVTVGFAFPVKSADRAPSSRSDMQRTCIDTLVCRLFADCEQQSSYDEWGLIRSFGLHNSPTADAEKRIRLRDDISREVSIPCDCAGSATNAL